MRRQEEGERVDPFIISLYRLAEHCNCHDLHNEMIWDQIVVGLCDSNLSRRLQTDPELTLNKAITMTRQTEAVREQQAVVRGETDSICTRMEQKIWNMFQLSKIPNQPTRKVATDVMVAIFQQIQVPNSWSYMP